MDCKLYNKQGLTITLLCCLAYKWYTMACRLTASSSSFAWLQSLERAAGSASCLCALKPSLALLFT